MSSVDEQLAAVVGPDERQALTAGLSPHTLHELSLVLIACEDADVRALIVTEVLAAIPEYSDRAMLVALARVSYARNDMPGAGGSAS